MARSSLASLVLAACAASAAAPPPPRARAQLLRPSAPHALSRPRSAAPDDPSIVSVLDFGAIGNGIFDNTAAFQAALDSLALTGGEVLVPDGNFSFTGSLVFPKSVAMTGTFLSVPSHDVAQGAPIPNRGSILLVRGGRGNESGTPFMSLVEDCGVRGLVFYWPDNVRGQAPAPYPYAIALSGNNPAVEDVELLNAYNGISAVGAARHYIARVQGQPCNVGIFVDQTYDIGRIEDVHWNPWWDSSLAYCTHQTTQGIGFLIARTDWEYVFNTFVFGMAVGYEFVKSSTGSCNGNFIGIGADACQNASVLVASSDPWGILITNGEFTSFNGGFGPDQGAHTQVVIAASNTGAVRIVNSAFWGPSNQIARAEGTGSIGFESCIFNDWDAAKTGAPAISILGGDALIRGNDFQRAHAGGQVLLGAGAGKVIVTENLVSGPLGITNQGAKLLINQNNAPDS